VGKFARFSLAILRKKLCHMEIQINENNSSNADTDNVNHSDRSASKRVLLPFSIEAILSSPHQLSPLSSLENFTRSNLPATENAERGMMKIQLLV